MKPKPLRIGDKIDSAPPPKHTPAPLEGISRLEAAMHSKEHAERLRVMEKTYGEDRVFGGHIPMRQIEVWPSGFIDVDQTVLQRGGFPRGRICEIHGAESSGKTTFLLQCIANFQQRLGLRCRFIDLEDAMDEDYARANGVRTDLWTYLIPKSAEQAIVMAMEGLSGKILSGKNTWKPVGPPDDVVVIDSTGAMRPATDTAKPVEGDGSRPQMAGRANLQEKLVMHTKPLLFQSRSILFLISQVRVNMDAGPYGKKTRSTTSKALDHEFTVRLEVSRGNAVKNGDAVIGRKIKFKGVKNKIGAEAQSCEIYMAFGEGLSKEFMLVDTAIRTRVLQKSGAWLSWNGERIANGREQARVVLRDNPEMARKIEAEVQHALKTGERKALQRFEDTLEDLGGAPVFLDEEI